MCPGTELNRYLHCCKRDFKSRVSTNFTTGASLVFLREEKRKPKKNSRSGGSFFGAEDRARTGHLDLGKVALYQMSYFRIVIKDLLFLPSNILLFYSFLFFGMQK